MELGFESGLKADAVLVSNQFVDKYMAAANGEYVKVYLYILRHQGEAMTLASIADALEHTESDIRRALGYWEKLGLLLLREKDNPGSLETAAGAQPEPRAAGTRPDASPMGTRTDAGEKPQADQKAGTSKTAERPVYTPAQLERLNREEDFAQLLYIAQKYLKKAFTERDSEVFAYLYDGLHLSIELLEYLVEYCAQNGHTSLRYVETVAINWHKRGLLTVAEAKAYADGFGKDTYGVMRAFGLTDRQPAAMEREKIHTWYKVYGFSREIVAEACNRTMDAIHTPSFQYADKILSEWHKAGVKTMQDVRELDKKRGSRPPKQAEKSAVPSRNQFHNFEQRNTDYDAIVLEQWKEK